MRCQGAYSWNPNQACNQASGARVETFPRLSEIFSLGRGQVKHKQRYEHYRNDNFQNLGPFIFQSKNMLFFTLILINIFFYFNHILNEAALGNFCYLKNFIRHHCLSVLDHGYGPRFHSKEIGNEPEALESRYWLFALTMFFHLKKEKLKLLGCRSKEEVYVLLCTF